MALESLVLRVSCGGVEASALTTDGSRGEAPAPQRGLRRGLCAVLCGGLAVGTCLHVAAAVAALALGVGMMVIAFAGDAARWVGLGLVAVLGAIAALEICVIRQKR